MFWLGGPPPAVVATVAGDDVGAVAEGRVREGKLATNPPSPPALVLLQPFALLGTEVCSGIAAVREKAFSKLAKFPLAEKGIALLGTVGVDPTELELKGSFPNALKMSTFDLNVVWFVGMVAAEEIGVGHVAELGVAGCDL